MVVVDDRGRGKGDERGFGVKRKEQRGVLNSVTIVRRVPLLTFH